MWSLGDCRERMLYRFCLVHALLRQSRLLHRFTDHGGICMGMYGVNARKYGRQLFLWCETSHDLKLHTELLPEGTYKSPDWSADPFKLQWNKTLEAVFSVCNHRQVTNVSGFLCRWKKRLGMAATRRTQSRALTQLTPRRPTTHSIITGRMIAAGVSALCFSAFTAARCFPITCPGSQRLIVCWLNAD